MPLTPFGASVYLPAVEHGLAAMLDTWGLPMQRVRSARSAARSTPARCRWGARTARHPRGG